MMAQPEFESETRIANQAWLQDPAGNMIAMQGFHSPATFANQAGLQAQAGIHPPTGTMMGRQDFQGPALRRFVPENGYSDVAGDIMIPQSTQALAGNAQEQGIQNLAEHVNAAQSFQTSEANFGGQNCPALEPDMNTDWNGWYE